jgi:glycosidase
MQWNDKVHAGFSSVEPWLPVFTDYASCNVAAQSKDPDSMLSFYRRLLWLRRESRALHGGSFLSLNSPSDCFVYLREVRNERRLIALNFSARSQMINLTAEVFLAGQETPRLLLSTHSVRDHGENLRRLSLHPYEGVMLAL